jgi:hypothetical protein
MASKLFPANEPPDREPVDSFGSLDTATRRKLESVDAEKRRALEEPGKSWHDWFYFDALRWWSIIGFLIVDSWIATGWIAVGSYVGLALSLVLASYLEFLLFEVFWYRPDLPVRRWTRKSFHRTPLRPVEVGRWTPERALRDRARLSQEGLAEDAVNPEEFL